jgi:hypothetical protein
MISCYERKKRKYNTAFDTRIKKSTMRKIHNAGANMNTSHASATPNAAMSKTRPEIREKFEKLL